MEFLRITAANGIHTYVPDNYVTSLTVAADTTENTTSFKSGKITAVKYLDAAAASAPVTVAPAIVAYDGTNIRYQYGIFSPSGIFQAWLTS